MALWGDIEHALTALQDAGEPDISTVRLHITDRAHAYWIGDWEFTAKNRSPLMEGKSVSQWEHRFA
ncbi:hypothetical protein ACFYO0_38115 [Streptomyces sp. NPDC006365]|uniref:hypothetical protein n=1 Tax=Streptomyces sp. NPDC006365 TaxID=3364744 RepID=UPI0036BE355F